MPWFLVQIIGIICGGIGMILTWIITLMPQWRVSILAENNGLINGRVDGQWMSRLDGLWTSCISHGRLSQHCNSYESVVSITTDLKSGRVLMSFAITMTVIAFICSLVGMLYTRCYYQEDRIGRRCLHLTAGILYILSVGLILIPVSWTTSNIVRKAYDASICRGAMRIEMGEALFLAWPTLVFLLIAGIILCWICPCTCRNERCEYVPPRDHEMVCRGRQEGRESSTCYNKSEYI
ncbi:claudin-8-like [Rhinophrynus dorsalis]